MDSVSDYYSATQLRTDRWSALREVTSGLARNMPGKISAKDRTKVQELFKKQDVIEFIAHEAQLVNDGRSELRVHVSHATGADEEVRRLWRRRSGGGVSGRLSPSFAWDGRRVCSTRG